MPLPSKSSLRDELLARLRDELEQLERAHHATLEGATHEEARPENSKDTRALEQSYLARGQAARVEELRRAVVEVATMPTPGASAMVGLGGLVTTTEDEVERVLFVAPQGGGSTLAGGRVHVVTPLSPLGRAVMGREVGDVCELATAGRERSLEVLRID